jgi:hypothetical protein
MQLSAFSLSLDSFGTVHVSKRLSLTTGGGVVNYQYDAANRLTSVNGQAYTWDDNGNPSTGGSTRSPHNSGQAC